MDDMEVAEEYLVRWGTWNSTRIDNALGYPSVCPSFKEEINGSGSGAVVLVPSSVIAVDEVIAGLKERNTDLFNVAMLYYVTGMPVSSVAFRCRCHRDTVYARLNRIRRIVAYHVMRSA